MDSLHDYLVHAPEEIRDKVLSWADSQQVRQANLIPYCFSNNDGFARAVGLDPPDTLSLWRSLQHHKVAWQSYRERQEERLRAAEPLSPARLLPGPPPRPRGTLGLPRRGERARAPGTD